MDADQSDHPTDQTLRSFGLGKLEDRAAEAVNEHLMECSACRNRVAEISSDSFLNRLRDTHAGGQSLSGRSQAGGMAGDKGKTAPVPPPASTLPPGLAAHPGYEIRRELGRGGMGVVYLAHNVLMGRDEVLKVMGREIMERPGVLERFLREIRAVARLRHPNIVTAFSAVRIGESIVFAMEYIEGLDLSRLVQAKGPLPVGYACNFVRQAALGLQHAHEEGLVHRDIKPGNLMLARTGDRPIIKVLDFGLAKATREEKVAHDLTWAGQALGTPDYIAPKQIIDAPTADIRADIYSLGGTLYYLLSGRPAFREKSLYDLYQAHISRIPEPLNRVCPEVPAELAAVVARMMAKDPARRFQTPGELAEALTPFFKKANVPFKNPRTDVSRDSSVSSGRPVPGSLATPTQPSTGTGTGTGTGAPDTTAAKPAELAVFEIPWASLFDIQVPGSSAGATPAVGSIRRPPWVWPAVAVGMVMLGLLAAWLGGAFRVNTFPGAIVLANVPKGSEVLVDGVRATVNWPGGDTPLEIRAVPGQRQVEVKNDGFQTYVAAVTVRPGASEEIRVWLQPLVADRHGSNREVIAVAKTDEKSAPASGSPVAAREENSLSRRDIGLDATIERRLPLFVEPLAYKSGDGQDLRSRSRDRNHAAVGTAAPTRDSVPVMTGRVDLPDRPVGELVDTSRHFDGTESCRRL